MKGYPTIAEALTLGGEELAVDGVLIIGEHGEYPTNEKGQRLYPRYEHFMQIAEVYEKSGRGVPTFNDKHLSYSFEKAKEMVDDGHRLGFGCFRVRRCPSHGDCLMSNYPWSAK